MQKIITYSEEETKSFAQNLAYKIKKGVIALYGDLGAGKTTFAAGFAKGLGIKEKIISPTFVLIRQHKIPNSKNMLFHIDLYRLKDSKSLKNIGLEEILSNPQNLTILEWAEKAERYLPKKTIKINLRKINTQKREIIIL